MQSLNRAVAMATMSELADNLFTPDMRDKVMGITFGKQGEVAKHLKQETLDDIALIILDHWQKVRETTPSLPTELQAEILRLHKTIFRHPNKQSFPYVQLGHMVAVLPTGQVAIMVMHLQGFEDEAEFTDVNHCVLLWDFQKEEWILEKYMDLLKSGAVAKAFREIGEDTVTADDLIAALTDVKPYKDKTFKRLDKALAEAYHFCQMGRVLLKSLVATPASKKSFNAIPPLTSLKPDESLLLDAAMQMAQTVPSIYDFNQMIEEKVSQN